MPFDKSCRHASKLLQIAIVQARRVKPKSAQKSAESPQQSIGRVRSKPRFGRKTWAAYALSAVVSISNKWLLHHFARYSLALEDF
jgi:hypothetical protein